MRRACSILLHRPHAPIRIPFAIQHSHARGRRAVADGEQFLAEVIAPRAGQPDVLPLENLLQALLLSQREPIALEIVGTSTSRRLLIRATSARSLAHVSAQLRARMPQAEVFQVSARARDEAHVEAHDDTTRTPDTSLRDECSPGTRLSADPLAVALTEDVRAMQLRPREAAHLPLKLYEECQLGAPGVDPLLGVFAAMNGLPDGCRVVVQLALAPAPEAWSRHLQRYAVEHPLAQERERTAAAAHADVGTRSGTSGIPLVPLLALVLLVAVGRHLMTWLPPSDRRSYHAPPSPHTILLAALAVGGALVTVAAWVWLRAQRRTRIYSMSLVEERTKRVAARTCLSLVAIGPVEPVVSADGTQPGQGTSYRMGRQRPHVALATWEALETVLDQLVAAYRQHALASGNGLAPRRLSRRAARQHVVRWARRAQRSAHLLTVRELAALWHLPGDDAAVPFLERTRAKRLLAPVAPLSAGYRLGGSAASGHVVPVRLPADALRRNALLVAKTGKGKSTLLQHLALARLLLTAEGPTTALAAADGIGAGDQTAASGGVAGGTTADTAERSAVTHLMRARSGLVVVDPHGDLIHDLLSHLPSERRNDVVVVNLADTAYPIALNPLDALLGRDRDKAVESLLGILAQIWSKFWGPRMQNALEYALKTLYEANEALIAADPQHGPDRQYTLLDVAPLLTTPSFRKEVLASVHDLTLRSWWKHYYDGLDVRLRTEVINPVLTKMAAFSGSRVARRIVGQGRSTLDLAELVREGQALLVNTARGVVGAETAILVGATLLGTLAVTLEEQARLYPGDRRQLLVVVDEFQTLLGVDYGAMLSELRKFGGTFALATQALAHLDALDPTLRPTVLANVDALYAFATSAEDARVLAHELDDAVDVVDLINQDDYTCYVKLTLNGQRLPVFSLTLDPPRAGDPEIADRLQARARLRHARPVAEVEALLASAATRYTPPHEARRDMERAQPTEANQHAPVVALPAGEERALDSAAPVLPAAGRGRRGWRQPHRPDRQGITAAEDLWAGLAHGHRAAQPQSFTAHPRDPQGTDDPLAAGPPAVGPSQAPTPEDQKNDDDDDDDEGEGGQDA